MLVESKESRLAPVESKTKEAKENRRTAQAKERALLEQGEQAAVVEPKPQRALASSLDLASFETLGRSPYPDPEVWLKWTYDTGAAISAFPLDANLQRNGVE